MIQQFHSWAYIQIKRTHKDTCTPMFIAAVFTIARHGNSLNALKQRNGYRRCGTYIQWHTTQA